MTDREILNEIDMQRNAAFAALVAVEQRVGTMGMQQWRPKLNMILNKSITGHFPYGNLIQNTIQNTELNEYLKG